jgi:hypothetical protein
MLIHTCNVGTWKAEAGGSQIQGQPGLHREPVSKQNKNKNKNKTKQKVQNTMLGWEV